MKCRRQVCGPGTSTTAVGIPMRFDRYAYRGTCTRYLGINTRVLGGISDSVKHLSCSLWWTFLTGYRGTFLTGYPGYPGVPGYMYPPLFCTHLFDSRFVTDTRVCTSWPFRNNCFEL
eukprot:2756046-Rhodomonas_salina.1